LVAIPFFSRSSPVSPTLTFLTSLVWRVNAVTRYFAVAWVSVPLTERIWKVIRYPGVQHPASARSRPRPFDVIESERVCPPHVPANVARLAGGAGGRGPPTAWDRRQPRTVARTLLLGTAF